MFHFKVLHQVVLSRVRRAANVAGKFALLHAILALVGGQGAGIFVNFLTVFALKPTYKKTEISVPQKIVDMSSKYQS